MRLKRAEIGSLFEIGGFQMNVLIFITSLVFCFAVGSVIWFGVNVVTGGNEWLSMAVALIAGVSWLSFAKLLQAIQLGESHD